MRELSDTGQTPSDFAAPLPDVGRTLSDTDTALSSTDQALSNTDQALSNTDQAGEDAAQVASDRDQAAADRDHAKHPPETDADESSYLQSRGERAETSLQRYATGRERSASSHERDTTAETRDQVAQERDDTTRSRLTDAPSFDQDAATAREALLLAELQELRLASARERARAAAERLERAKDREAAARERGRLETELRSAHLDSLTGAFRREMGPTAIASEMERMRRSGGSMVVAFVDVNGLKPINDNEGHEAGDDVLRAVVRVVHQHLRPYDSVIRYGGDEFVCVLGGVDVAQAERRFAAIASVIEAQARVTVSVGFATQEEGDTPDRMVSRADAAMLDAKRRHHSA